jgi:phosphoribosylglycinamide formyltransferase-1
VHFVDEQLDHGPIIIQRSVEVRDDDTAETLSERILAIEHETYIEAVRRIAAGEIDVKGRRVLRTG